ncbi:unnamed protein product [Paramecium octaurelia]|uniref:Uncharacterized protein n=1 Tax=Paramecium octaurelia TaxID=43137 RepID=A0A8S1YRW2_PAROT|nr:unnamed protein product [Paramecium octaurelia]
MGLIPKQEGTPHNHSQIWNNRQGEEKIFFKDFQLDIFCNEQNLTRTCNQSVFKRMDLYRPYQISSKLSLQYIDETNSQTGTSSQLVIQIPK